MKGRILVETVDNVYYNLALEHAILQNASISEEKTFTIRFWRNSDKCVILGRSQSVEREIDLEYCDSNNIKIARRISGGGTVYEDVGTLNISFFLNNTFLTDKNYSEKWFFLTKIIMESIKAALSIDIDEKNINLRIINRSSILIQLSNKINEERKISGSADYISKDWFLHHATLLLSTNLDNLNRSLKARKGVKFYDSTLKSSSKDHITTNLKELTNIANFQRNIAEITSKQLKINFFEYGTTKKEKELANKYIKMYISPQWTYHKERSFY